MGKFSYYLGKAIQKLQIPTLRNCTIDPSARVCQKSNLVNVRLDRYSYIGVACSINNVEIGSFCSIASYCAIGGGEHPLEYVSTSPVFIEGNNIFRKHFADLAFEDSPLTEIGSDVWIGEASFIKAGVRIGDGAVVGAHSVVTRDVPPYAIVAGAPARVIRYRFDMDTIKSLIQLQWWNWPDEKIAAKAYMFNDPRLLIGGSND